MSALSRPPGAPHPRLDRPRLVLVAGVLTALLLVLALGTDTVWFALTDTYGGRLLRPAALGLPLFLPGLRPDPRGDTTWAYLWCEDFAALLLLGVVALVLRRHVLRHPYATRPRRLLTGWFAVVLGGAVAGFFRGLVEARMTADGPIGWTGYSVSGAVAGALWGVALGWTVGVAVAAVSGGTALRRIARGLLRLGGWARRRVGPGVRAVSGKVRGKVSGWVPDQVRGKVRGEVSGRLSGRVSGAVAGLVSRLVSGLASGMAKITGRP